MARNFNWRNCIFQLRVSNTFLLVGQKIEKENTNNHATTVFITKKEMSFRNLDYFF